jgi:hypothetical protein
MALAETRAMFEGDGGMKRKPDRILFGCPVARKQGSPGASPSIDENGDEPGVKLKKPAGCEPRATALTVVALQGDADQLALKRAEASCALRAHKDRSDDRS